MSGLYGQPSDTPIGDAVEAELVEARYRREHPELYRPDWITYATWVMGGGVGLVAVCWFLAVVIDGMSR